MKLITRDTDYALRALCFIARRKDEKFSVAQLSRRLRIPGPFLRKILQILNKKKIVKSSKGQGGGFLLARSPARISLPEVMEIFQGRLRLNECSLHKVICPFLRVCPLRKGIAKIERYVLKELNVISIASLIS